MPGKEYAPLKYNRTGNVIQFNRETDRRTISIITPWIVNVFAPLQTDERFSYSIEGLPVVECPIQIYDRAGFIEIETEALKIHVFNDFKIDFYSQDGVLLCADFDGERRPFIRRSADWQIPAKTDIGSEEAPRISVTKRMLGPEKFYGLGETAGYLNKRGYAYEMWNTDDPSPHVESHQSLYKSIPFLITLLPEAAFGIFFDNTFRARFDLGKENRDYYYFEADDGNLDYYFIAGPEIEAVVTRYTSLTGRVPLPQLWTLGYHQCRWSYNSWGRIGEIAAGFRNNGIPCDALYLDIDYMDGYRVFTWDRRNFPDPSKMAAELAGQGFKLVAIIDPGVKKDDMYPVYKTGLENGYFVVTKDGIPYVGRVWPGESLFPDFSDTAVREWWAGNLKTMLDSGIAGIWNDMNEPSSFDGPLPNDLQFKNDGRPAEHREIHNVYGHLMSRATYTGIKNTTGRRPFVITRACFAGTQKYAVVWTGDNQSFWEHLRLSIPMLLNLGLSGFAFCGADIGGFSFDCSGELLARWIQVGCFTPLFRNHSATKTRDQEPWAFDKEVLDISRKYIQLRYQLLPYLYDLMRLSEQSGLPVLRPLVFHYQRDEKTHQIYDQFLCGPNILVAPILEQGRFFRAVYLPDGLWFDFNAETLVEGNQVIIAEAGPDTCPVYIKAGSIIPRFPVQNYVGEKEISELILDIYPGSGHYTHYQDDGISFAYLEGQYNLYEFTLNDTECLTLQIRTTHTGYSEKYRTFRVIANYLKPREIRLNGRPIDFETENGRAEFVIPAVDGEITIEI